MPNFANKLITALIALYFNCSNCTTCSTIDLTSAPPMKNKMCINTTNSVIPNLYEEFTKTMYICDHLEYNSIKQKYENVIKKSDSDLLKCFISMCDFKGNGIHSYLVSKLIEEIICIPSGRELVATIYSIINHRREFLSQMTNYIESNLYLFNLSLLDANDFNANISKLYNFIVLQCDPEVYQDTPYKQFYLQSIVQKFIDSDAYRLCNENNDDHKLFSCAMIYLLVDCGMDYIKSFNEIMSYKLSSPYKRTDDIIKRAKFMYNVTDIMYQHYKISFNIEENVQNSCSFCDFLPRCILNLDPKYIFGPKELQTYSLKNIDGNSSYFKTNILKSCRIVVHELKHVLQHLSFNALDDLFCKNHAKDSKFPKDEFLLAIKKSYGNKDDRKVQLHGNNLETDVMYGFGVNFDLKPYFDKLNEKTFEIESQLLSNIEEFKNSRQDDINDFLSNKINIRFYYDLYTGELEKTDETKDTISNIINTPREIYKEVVKSYIDKHVQRKDPTDGVEPTIRCTSSI